MLIFKYFGEYLNSSADLVPKSIQNVVINGVADNITLKEAADGNNFYCPVAFTARRISYEHNYSMKSGYKECRGWETIALPFDVTSIMSETGTYVVPRAAWSLGDTEQKLFFLYEWTANGWQVASAIKANTPYIISMPNNENYESQYQLKGNFEFVGNNVQVLPSVQQETVAYKKKMFVPNFQNQPVSQEILALNVTNLWNENSRTDYVEGSAFIRGLRQVRPFEAYMMVESSAAPILVIPVLENDEATGITNIPMRQDMNHDVWYTIDGRKLQKVPAADGVYIKNGKKIVVK